MNHSFLHISDIHFQPDRPEDIELVLARFFSDAREQLAGTTDPYAIISGDLVKQGSSARAFSDIVSRLDSGLNSIGIPANRRICVPGNHDVSQSELATLYLMHKSTLGAIRNETHFNDQYSHLAKPLFAGPLANYVKAEGELAEIRCCGTSLGGHGWDLPNGLGVYCLNTALCSSAAFRDPDTGAPMSDRGRLHVDTRSLHAWLHATKSTFRLLVMHHPIEWLSEWAAAELGTVASQAFQLVVSGHVHRGCSTLATRVGSRYVHCVAPALFTGKHDHLGYATIHAASTGQSISVHYRQWTQHQTFVAGTSLANNNAGIVSFDSPAPLAQDGTLPDTAKSPDTEAVLQAEFDEASTCYSSKRQFWVHRDLATKPEVSDLRKDTVIISPDELAQHPRTCIIQAPKQFGLTCIGHYIALAHYRHATDGTAIALMETTEFPNHTQGILEAISERCNVLHISTDQLSGIILDKWQNEKNSRRILRTIQEHMPEVPLILLRGLDDCRNIAEQVQWDGLPVQETLFLWSLSRSRIRELAVEYIEHHDNLDDDAVTDKLISDLDALNIHRTPLNCLLMLKLLSQAFEESPVNRTEMIGRVLFLLFHEFNRIPTYALRPDLKDCEYAIGYLCEWLIRQGRYAFTKSEFYKRVGEYCSSQLLDLDSEVLLLFLVTENILIRRGDSFEFRFRYWLLYFAAHRMLHNHEFAAFILGDGRYASMPEIIEFYTGIDRRREDAVQKLTDDLQRMNTEFSARTGLTDEFEPYLHALWKPNEDSLKKMEQEIVEEIADSALPKSVKDAIADESYDRAKPYNQELSQFIRESSLLQLMQAMRGAARALRNSDHVNPDAKKRMLSEIVKCWVRVNQVLVVLSMALVKHREATFEGMGFCLSNVPTSPISDQELWQLTMNCLPDNVVRWYQEDIFSKKLGTLFTDYLASTQGSLGELLILLLLVRQRPPNWERAVESFILRSSKNHFGLNRVFNALRSEYRTSFASDRSRQQLRRLAAMAVAKHLTGVKQPGAKLIEEQARKNVDPSKRA